MPVPLSFSHYPFKIKQPVKKYLARTLYISLSFVLSRTLTALPLHETPHGLEYGIFHSVMLARMTDAPMVHDVKFGKRHQDFCDPMFERCWGSAWMTFTSVEPVLGSKRRLSAWSIVTSGPPWGKRPVCTQVSLSLLGLCL